MPLSTAFQSQIYRPLPEMERADSIVERISKGITLGMLRVGERLPTEAELSEKFGVAAATLRDALAELRDLGIVETRRGRNGGTFIVAQPSTSPDEMRRLLAGASIADLRDFGDEQAAVAAETVRLACERAEAHELERLLELGRALVLADSPDGRARADSRFHIELAVTAQSPRLTSAEIRLQAESVQLVWAPLAQPFDTEQATAEHLALVRAISDDRPDEAQRLVRLHIRRAVHHLIDTKLALEYSAAIGEAQASARAAVPHDGVARIAEWFGRASEDVDRFARDVTADLAARLGARATVTPKDLAGLEGLSGEFLSGHPVAISAGAVFSPEVVSDGARVLEWWVAQPDSRPTKLLLDLTPGGPRYYDYEKLPFFTTALATGQQTIWGPYVDYLGSDEYILTHTAPIAVAGRLAAVVGYDMRIRDLETAIMPALRTIPGGAALLNASGRVVIDNSGRYLVGERVPSEPHDAVVTPLGVPGLGYAVLTQH